jgi:hypothetical protein
VVATHGKVFHHPSTPQAKLFSMLRDASQVIYFVSIFRQVEQLLLAVESMIDVLHPAVGKGGPVVLPAVANPVFEIDVLTSLRVGIPQQ